jgi:hypothetical protein
MKSFYFKIILLGVTLLLLPVSLSRWQPHDALPLGSPFGLSSLLFVATLALWLPKSWGYPIAGLCSFLVAKKITDDWLGWNSELSGVVSAVGSVSYGKMVEHIQSLSLEYTTEGYVRDALFLGLALIIFFYSLTCLVSFIIRRQRPFTP